MSNLQDLARDKRLLTINPLKIKQGWELKRLSDKHKTIVSLHIQGVKRIDIAVIADCTPEYVSMIVAQPLAQAYMKELEAYTDDALKRTYGKAVEVIGECLDSDDEEIKLKAARLSLEATGKMKGTGEKAQSAEDLVANILANATNVIVAHNVQVNNRTGE